MAATNPHPDPVVLAQATGAVSGVQHAAADPSIDLAEQAARQALAMAGIPEAQWSAIPVFLGVSKGAVHAVGSALAERSGFAGQGAGNVELRIAKGEAGEMPFSPVAFLVHHLRRRLGMPDIRPVVAACASSLTALHLARLYLLGQPHPLGGPGRALVLTSEAALLPLFIHSYRRLGVLPPLTPAGYRARPLDRDRHGFVLSEQAAAVVLEHPDVACPTPPPRGPTTSFLLDSAIACEGYDLMQPAPGMPALRHVARRLLAGRSVDVLHPHATATIDNDANELAVYGDVLGEQMEKSPALEHSGAGVGIYAAKGALGHGLGAAGLTSLVIACLAARTRQLPPMPWLANPIAAGFLHPHPQPSGLGSSTAHAIFAAGFGGHVAGAVICS